MLKSLFAIAVLLPAGLWAQSAGNSYNGYGFVAATLGNFEHGPGVLGVHGGGDALFARRLGISADLGVQWPRNRIQAAAGMFSVGPTVHFARRDQRPKLVPFVTGGYSAIFRNGYGNLAHIGGGATYFFKDRVGLRLEGRALGRFDSDVVFYQFRVGLAFR